MVLATAMSTRDMAGRTRHPKRLLWIVNHKTLLPAEVPILGDLGWEVFIPKIIPTDADYRSGVVTFEYDNKLTIHKDVLDILNKHDFYCKMLVGRSWSPTVEKILNENFDLIITTVSGYITPLREAVRQFDGTVMARVFGLEDPRSYAGLIEALGLSSLLDEISDRQEKFVFAQGYSNLADIEPSALGKNSYTITVPLPPSIYQHTDTWHGKDNAAIFLCPAIRAEGGYYKNIYDRIKSDFGEIPHKIFGRQIQAIDDAAILPYLSDQELIGLYAGAPVFIYPSTEQRHIHYSPIEAMVIGTPVLYRRNSLSDTLAERADAAGACSTTDEMLGKAKRLLAGDRELADNIRSSQYQIVRTFSEDVARQQWASALGRVEQNPRRAA